MIDELRRQLEEFRSRYAALGGHLDPSGAEARLSELEARMAEPGFWDEGGEAALLRERSVLQATLERCHRLDERLADVATLIELAEEGEEEALNLGRDALAQLESEIAAIEIQHLLGDPDDARPALVEIHPGAGGTESQDWAATLLRMYSKWAESQRFQVEVLDETPGEEAGIKSATLRVEGEFAFGYLKGETGVHRLVRISPFDASHRRHTSFASVLVSPEVDEDIEVVIDEKDLRIDTYRSSGAGGQHVNVTDSAVRITHLPTGIVVQCQAERSQHRNRAMAMKVLKSRLYEFEKRKQQEKLDERHAGKKEIGWGSQIRSYVLHPYRMAKDHRTGVEVGNVDAVLDGHLGEFVEAYLRLRSLSE
ncbi:MAG: peptide chain release factor 2 [Acidobacteriota bacterium]